VEVFSPTSTRSSGILLIERTDALDGAFEPVVDSPSVIKTVINLAFDFHKTEAITNFHTRVIGKPLMWSSVPTNVTAKSDTFEQSLALCLSPEHCL
jgi:hypothetical protein